MTEIVVTNHRGCYGITGTVCFVLSVGWKGRLYITIYYGSVSARQVNSRAILWKLIVECGTRARLLR